VLREVGAVLPFWKREIDAVLATHPDGDHIGGLPDIFERYQINYFIEPGIPRDTGVAKELYARVAKEPGIERITARRGMRLDLGGGAYADILYPDRDPSKMEINDGSVVVRLSYGTTSFMLTGDLSSKIEDWLLVLDEKSGKLPVTVLKVGHHGSKYSTNEAWVAKISPQVAAISVGARNSYGHPTFEVLERLTATGVKVERTDLSGRLIFISNGKEVTTR
jgi:competence protein ComEC